MIRLKRECTLRISYFLICHVAVLHRLTILRGLAVLLRPWQMAVTTCDRLFWQWRVWRSESLGTVLSLIRIIMCACPLPTTLERVVYPKGWSLGLCPILRTRHGESRSLLGSTWTTIVCLFVCRLYVWHCHCNHCNATLQVNTLKCLTRSRYPRYPEGSGRLTPRMSTQCFR